MSSNRSLMSTTSPSTVRRYLSQFSIDSSLILFPDSPSFAAAVCDVQQFFPNGIQSHHPALVKYYQVQYYALLLFIFILFYFQVTMAPTDNLNPFPASPLPDTFHHSNMSPLMEHTCLVLPPSHITSSSTTPFVMVLDSVVRAEFTITDIQLVRFSSNMAEELCSCLDTQLKVWLRLWRIHCHCLTCSNLARLVNSPKELHWLFLFVELMLHRVSRGFLQGMCMNKYVELIINPVCQFSTAAWYESERG